GATVREARFLRHPPPSEGRPAMRRMVPVAVVVALAGLLATSTQAFASNPNGSGGDMPAFYDAQLFTINFKLLKPDLHNNPSFNTIYQCDSSAQSGLNFISVLDAIQGDGVNPIWEEGQVTVHAGCTAGELSS